MVPSRDTMTPLETALARLAEAEQTATQARLDVAAAALDQARLDGERGDVYARAAALLGVSERTFHRMRKVTKSVTSDDSR